MSSEPLERRQQLHLEQLEQAAYALAKDEARINRLAVMVGLLTVGLTAIAILSVLIIQLSDYNNYLFGALIVFLPVLFGIPAIVYVRNQHVGAYRKYHSQLMAKTAQFQLSAVTDPL
ncbi:MAG TPA: hypothetical protein VNL15_02270, partial [Dehalococcoidia bacterium]|nr:hypothetical protein [Dehalococcoidia bacterium]